MKKCFKREKNYSNGVNEILCMAIRYCFLYHWVQHAIGYSTLEVNCVLQLRH